jgi:hypothetical protein
VAGRAGSGREEFLAEAEDAAAQRVHDVVGQVDREAARAEHADHGVQIFQHGRGPGLDHLRGPGLADDHVDHAVEQFLFAGHVLVDRHRNAAAVNARDWHTVRGDPYLARLSFGVRRPRVTWRRSGPGSTS